MLLTRSILAQASILFLITLVTSQNYQPDYQVTEGDSDGHSEYSEDGNERPDYSKFFSRENTDASQPFLAPNKEDSGFVSPLDFSSFFKTPNLAFGALSNQEAPIPSLSKKEEVSGFVPNQDFKSGFAEYDVNGFGTQDYFDQAQKQESKKEEDIKVSPGPSYVSQRVPVKKGYEEELKTFRKKPSQFKNKKEEIEDTQETREDKDSSEFTDFKPNSALDLAQFYLAKSGSPEISKKYTQAPTNSHPKFSYQQVNSPISYGQKHLSTPESINYEYLPSEISAENIKNDCIKANMEVTHTQGKFNKKPMDCYICKDPKSGAKSQHCSYNNDVPPSAYFHSNSESYGNPEIYRNKREETETYSDPYEEIKAKSHKYFSKPEDFDKDLYKAPDFSKIGLDYEYSPLVLHDKENEDKSYSEIQSEALAKQGDKCTKSHKNGVTCMVCKDPKTGGNYEQCSYESEPNEKKYAYVRESNYDGNDKPLENTEDDSTSKEEASEDKSKFVPLRRSDTENKFQEENKDSEQEDESKSTKSYNVPSHFVKSTFERENAGVRGLDPALYGGPEVTEKEETEDAPKYSELDDYHLKLFPQFADQESKRKETRTELNNPYFEDLNKKEVEKVLEEFTKKDRTNCKQIRKKGMTCYLCVNEKGIKQEECMFVSESRPKNSHIAYHEIQQVKEPEPKKDAIKSENKVEPVQVVAATENEKRKKFFKKATSVDSEANASSIIESRVVPDESTVAKIYKKHKRYTKDKGKQRAKSEDPEPQFDTNDEGGLYSAETRPVFSKKFGVTVPKYVVEKSAFEIDFDRSVSAG